MIRIESWGVNCPCSYSKTRAKHGNSQFEHCPKRGCDWLHHGSELTVGFLSTPRRSLQREGLRGCYSFKLDCF